MNGEASKRAAHAAEVLSSDNQIWPRCMFYINAFMANPNTPANPYANARGILVNALGFTDDEAHKHIQNEITLASQRVGPNGE